MNPLLACTNGRRHNFIMGHCLNCGKSIRVHKKDCKEVNLANAKAFLIKHPKKQTK